MFKTPLAVEIDKPSALAKEKIQKLVNVDNKLETFAEHR
jgi:hypothetical protein